MQETIALCEQADPVAAERAVWTPRDEPAFYAHWHKILVDPRSDATLDVG